MKSEFILDRTAFGMTKMTDGVESAVTIQVSIGKPDRNAKPAQPSQESQSKNGKANAKGMGGLTAKVFLPNMLQY